MDGLAFRPLEPADAPSILRILQEAEIAEPVENFVDLLEIQESLSSPAVDLPNASVAVIADGEFVGFGYLMLPRPAQTWIGHLSGAVLPASRRRGIGRAVVDRLIEQARALRDRGHPGLPGELKMWVSDGQPSQYALGEMAGFTSRRYFFHMRADLVDHPAATSRALPGDAQMRVWTPDLDESTRLAYNDSFADHWGSVAIEADRWRTVFADSAFFRPQFCRLAVGDDLTVLGFVLVMEYPSETEANGFRTGYVDRVGTVRAARGRGIAETLMAESMSALAADGCRYADLEVDADSPTGAGRLYSRLGYAQRRRDEVLGLEF